MSESSLPLSELSGYVETTDALLLDAEKFLKLLPDREFWQVTFQASLIVYERKLMEMESCYVQFSAWDILTDVSPCEKSEITRSLGQLRRLSVVLKNILRMLREQLHIPDPDRMQEEMQLQMMRMNALHK